LLERDDVAVSWRATAGEQPTQDARLALYAAHLWDWALVDVWIVPIWGRHGNLCLLILARLVLWRRWAALAGLVLPLFKGVHWSNNARRIEHAKIAQHFCSLRARADWPRGTAPVLLLGCAAADTALISTALQDRGWSTEEAARLRPLDCSLSEHGATAGLRLSGFLAAPSRAEWALVDLVRRCQRARVAAGPACGRGRCAPLGEPTPAGAAFRRMLFARDDVG